MRVCGESCTPSLVLSFKMCVMKSLSFMNRELVLPENMEVYLMFGILSLLWHLGSSYMAMFPEFGTIDRNIFLLILLSFLW